MRSEVYREPKHVGLCKDFDFYFEQNGKPLEDFEQRNRKI